jgi:hypothetical protein
MAIYTFLLFSITTVFVALNARTSQLAYIDFRGFPGGPSVYTMSQYGKAIYVICNGAFVLTNWLADGLLVRRLSENLTSLNWKKKNAALPVQGYLGRPILGACPAYSDVLWFNR